MSSKTKVDPEPGAVNTDTLAEDVADEKLEYPDGTPELVPLLNLPRRQRAAAYEVIGQVAALRKQLKGDASDDDSDEDTVKQIDPADIGKHYQQVVLIEDYLRVVAGDERDFQAWSTAVSDADLVKAFNVYQRKTQPGEAESSAG